MAEEVELAYEQRKVLEKLECLNRREKKVIEMRYGLLNGFRKTQKEIAKKMGISRSYVSRIEKKAIEKLVKELNAEVAVKK